MSKPEQGLIPISEWTKDFKAMDKEDTMKKKSPLDIPEVLEHLLEYLPVEDLKTARLVNHLWKDCATPSIRKKSRTIFIGERRGRNNNALKDLARLNACIKETIGGSCKFPSYKFRLDVTMLRKRIHEVSFANFLALVSPWVAKLALILDSDMKKSFVTAFPRKFEYPRLEELRLVANRYVHAKEQNGFYQLVMNIMEKAVFLKSVDFYACGINPMYVECIEKGKNYKFTKLRLEMEIENEDLEKLSTLRGLRLKSLSMSFVHSILNDNDTSIKKFLDTQKNSLEELELELFSVDSPTVVNLPRMEKLTTLKIADPQDRICEEEDGEEEAEPGLVSFPGICYSKKFPSLKSLHLNKVYIRELCLCEQFLNESIQPIETMEELMLPYNIENDAVTVKNVKQVARIFPNLKKLIIPTVAPLIDAVFTFLTGLEELTLDSTLWTGRSYDYIDYMLLGLSKSKCKKIRLRAKRDGENFQWDQVELGKISKPITCLTKLKVLGLKGRGDRFELTSLTIYAALMNMPSLECVDLQYRGFDIDTSNIPVRALEDLKGKCLVLWRDWVTSTCCD